MSTDYAEKEREFLATLAADTGRDLGGWMAEISGKGLVDKNDIIDWLRREGFPFWKASWLERIHHNGGQPLYGSGPDVREPAGTLETSAESWRRACRAPAAPTAAPSAAPQPGRAASAPIRAEAPGAVPHAPAPAPQTPAPSLEELLARAKAFRPLAVFVMSGIGRVVPKAQFTARPGWIAVSAPAEFAALGISARELRLGLALGGARQLPGLHRLQQASTGARLPAGMSHFAVLTDARQVDTDLLALVAAAHANVNAST